MFRKILSAVGLAASASTTPAQPVHGPYADAGTNRIYHLLFADDAAAFAPQPGETPAAWQEALWRSPPNFARLQAIAADAAQEGRVRYLAARRLQAAGQPVLPKQLYGVIVEVPVGGGLDTLAAYSDGAVRYIHHSGRMLFAEGRSAFDEPVRRLFEAARPAVAAIGPWQQPRRPPPAGDQMRLSFLVSEGLHFGEGPMEAMQREAIAAPVIRQATELLQAVVAASRN